MSGWSLARPGAMIADFVTAKRWNLPFGFGRERTIACERGFAFPVGAAGAVFSHAPMAARSSRNDRTFWDRKCKLGPLAVFAWSVAVPFQKSFPVGTPTRADPPAAGSTAAIVATTATPRISPTMV